MQQNTLNSTPELIDEFSQRRESALKEIVRRYRPIESAIYKKQADDYRQSRQIMAWQSAKQIGVDQKTAVNLAASQRQFGISDQQLMQNYDYYNKEGAAILERERAAAFTFDTLDVLNDQMTASAFHGAEEALNRASKAYKWYEQALRVIPSAASGALDFVAGASLAPKKLLRRQWQSELADIIERASRAEPGSADFLALADEYIVAKNELERVKKKEGDFESRAEAWSNWLYPHLQRGDHWVLDFASVLGQCAPIVALYVLGLPSVAAAASFGQGVSEAADASEFDPNPERLGVGGLVWSGALSMFLSNIAPAALFAKGAVAAKAAGKTGFYNALRQAKRFELGGSKLKRWGISTALEGMTEFSQSVSLDAFRMYTSNEDHRIDWASALRDGVLGAAAGGAVSALVVSGNKNQLNQELQEISNQANDDLIDALHALKNAPPEKINQVITKFSNDGTVMVSPKGFNAYFQSAGVAEAQIPQALENIQEGLSVLYQNAVETGTNVPVDAGTFAEKIGVSEHVSALKGHISTDSDIKTAEQAKQEKELDAKLVEMINTALDKVLEVGQERVEVYNDIVSQTEDMRFILHSENKKTGKVEVSPPQKSLKLVQSVAKVLTDIYASHAEALNIPLKQFYQDNRILFSDDLNSLIQQGSLNNAAFQATEHWTLNTPIREILPDERISVVNLSTDKPSGETNADIEQSTKNQFKKIRESGENIVSTGKPYKVKLKRKPTIEEFSKKFWLPVERYRLRNSILFNINAIIDSAIDITDTRKGDPDGREKNEKIKALLAVVRDEGKTNENGQKESDSYYALRMRLVRKKNENDWTLYYAEGYEIGTDDNTATSSGIPYVQRPEGASSEENDVHLGEVRPPHPTGHPLNFNLQKIIDIVKTATPYFQSGDESKKRGAFFIDENGQPRISISDAANRSTLIHETAHWLLELYRKFYESELRTPELEADMQKLFKWWGVKDFSELTEKHHEKFAESFEQWFMEGIAPSKGLEKVFKLFAKWFKAIYQNGLFGADLNDDVRRVLDRMVTAESIKGAADAQLMSAEQDPVFANADQETIKAANKARDEELNAIQQDAEAMMRRNEHLLARPEVQAFYKKTLESLKQTRADPDIESANAALADIENGADPNLIADKYGFHSVEDIYHTASVSAKEHLQQLQYEAERITLLKYAVKHGESVSSMLRIEKAIERDLIKLREIENQILNQQKQKEAEENQEVVEGVDYDEYDISGDTPQDVLETKAFSPKDVEAIRQIIRTALGEKRDAKLAREVALGQLAVGQKKGKLVEASVYLSWAWESAQAMREGANNQNEAEVKSAQADLQIALAMYGETLKWTHKNALNAEKTEAKANEAELKKALANQKKEARQTINELKKEFSERRKQEKQRIKQEREAFFGQTPSQADFNSYAKERIHQMRVKDVSPNRYLTQANTLSRKATMMAAKGKLIEARDFTLQRMACLALFREAKQADAELRRAETRFKRLNDFDFYKKYKNTEAQDLLDVVSALMTAHGFRKGDVDDAARFAALKNRLPILEKQYSTTLFLPDSVFNPHRNAYKKWVVADALDLNTALSTLESAIKIASGDRVLYDGKTLKEVALQASNEVLALRTPAAADFGQSVEPNVFQKVYSAVSGVLRPESVIVNVFGENSMMHKLYHDIREKHQQKNEKLKEYYSKINNLEINHYTKEELRDNGVRNINVFGSMMTKWDLIGRAMYLGNDYSKMAMNESEEFQRVGKTTDDLMQILYQHMTQKDWDYVQKSWDIIDSAFSFVSEAYKAETGMSLDKQPAVEVHTPYSVLKGGYWPIAYRQTPGAADLRAAELEDIGSGGGDFIKSIFGRPSFTKRRIGSGGRNIDYSHGKLAKHIMRAMHYAFVHHSVAKTAMVLKHQSVRDAMMSTGQQWAQDTLTQWLIDTSYGGLHSGGFVDKMLANTSYSAMAFNFKTAAKQPLGVFGAAMNEVHPKYMLRAITNNLPNLIQSYRDTANVSVTMRDRRQMTDPFVLNAQSKNITTFSDTWLGGLGWMFSNFAQSLPDYVVWHGARLQGLEKGLSGDELIAYCDDIVERTQGTPDFSKGSAFERGTFQKAGVERSPYVKALSMFQSVPITTLDNMILQLSRFEKGEMPAHELAFKMINAFFVPYMISSLLFDGGPEEDEDYSLWAAKQFLLGFCSGAVPYVGTMAESMFMDRDGNLAVFRKLKETVDAVADAPKVISGDASHKAVRSYFKKLIGASGLVAGMPSTQLNRTIDAFLDKMDDKDPAWHEYFAGKTWADKE